MPYISKEKREKFIRLSEITPTTPGELNFCITMLCLMYLIEEGKEYKTLNEIIGILENVKLEFYRRSIVPYEDDKIRKNGDIPGYLER